MGEVEIKFGEGREGIVPTGTYLIDATRRMGVRLDDDCVASGVHACAFVIDEGAELLSKITAAEIEHFPDGERKQNARLACFAILEKPGVVVVMVKEKKEAAEESKGNERDEAYRKAFVDMPLEKKIANLAQLEAIALGETFAFVINSPFKVAEKIGDVMAEFGFKKEEAEKQRAHPPKGKSTRTGAKKSTAKTNSTVQEQKSP